MLSRTGRTYAEKAMKTQVKRLVTVLGCLALGVSDSLAGTAMQVAGSYVHTCAVTTGGGVLCWGNNSRGELGDGTTTTRMTPTAVSGLGSGVAAVAPGWYHTCAVTAGGGALCWGWNGSGELGDGTSTQRLAPTPVVGLGSGVAAIVAGGYHTCALTLVGGVVCWGQNYYGELGNGTTVGGLTPTAVSGLTSGVAAIGAGYQHTCALTIGGGVVCWGRNGFGQLGDGTRVDRSTPTPVTGLGSGVAAVAVGPFHTCAVTTTGGARCWGWNDNGQLGDGTTTWRSTPTAVTGLESGVVAVAVGELHTCALTTGGGVVCWGSNGYGQLGDGTKVDQWTPTAVTGLESGVVAVAVGELHTCALTTGGGVVCWGSNGYGQLGDGTTTQRLTPTPVVGFEARRPTGDFTGDLKSDILWRHATRGEVWLWPMDGAVKMAEWHVRTVGEPGWEVRGLGDQTGDGKADVLWRHTTGMLYLWTMSEETIVAETYLGTVDPAYDIVGTGDYNGDGRSDILWRNLTNGEVWIWLMDGATPLSEVYIDRVDPAYIVKGVGDLDGDDKADIVWHGAAGDVWVWLMNGTTRLSQSHVGTVPDLTYQIQQVADFDGNGKADLLWWNTARGEVWIWLMNGPAKVSENYVGTVPDTGYRIVGTGDYNGDGKADILWHHATRGEVWVWLMNGVVKLSENYVGSVPDVGYQIVKPK
jgi:alpha-tubulin suppressor-like RCC1 family protein